MSEVVRVTVAAGVTAALVALLVFSARDEPDLRVVFGGAVLFGLLVGGLVLLWGWALA